MVSCRCACRHNSRSGSLHCMPLRFPPCLEGVLSLSEVPCAGEIRDAYPEVRQKANCCSIGRDSKGEVPRSTVVRGFSTTFLLYARLLKTFSKFLSIGVGTLASCEQR